MRGPTLFWLVRQRCEIRAWWRSSLLCPDEQSLIGPHEAPTRSGFIVTRSHPVVVECPKVAGRKRGPHMIGPRRGSV
jgi:hypothetical protein